MYESPITMFVEQIQEELKKKQEETVVKAVFNAGFNVNKDELYKALKYDRNQYDKGYADGYSERDSEIVRCKDCKIWNREPINCATAGYCYLWDNYTREEEYCSKGVKQ